MTSGKVSARPSDQALAVPVEPVARLDPAGFDPSRGDDANEEIVGLVRQYAAEIFGGNCAFADDDLRLLAGMARRGVAMLDDLDESVRLNIDRLKGRGRWAGVSTAAAKDDSAAIAQNPPETSNG